MNSSLGHILLVANPAAQSGAGAAAAERAAANLRAALGEDAVTVVHAARQRDAVFILMRAVRNRGGLRRRIDFNPEYTTARDRSIPGRFASRYLLARSALSTR